MNLKIDSSVACLVITSLFSATSSTFRDSVDPDLSTKISVKSWTGIEGLNSAGSPVTATAEPFSLAQAGSSSEMVALSAKLAASLNTDYKMPESIRKALAEDWDLFVSIDS